jgi:hypothetical protein
MPSNDNDNSNLEQGAVALPLPRVVWRGGKPFVISNEDSVIHISKLISVPNALWRQGILLGMPDWANGDLEPPEQFLVLIVDLASRQKIAVSELETIVAHIEEARVLVTNRAHSPDIIAHLNMIADAARLAFRELDRQ